MSQRHLSFIALLAAGALLSGCSGGVSSPSDGANHSPDSNQTGLRVKMCVWLGVSRGLDLAFLNAD